MGEAIKFDIVRIPFGPKDKYICQEFLWPCIHGSPRHVLIGEEVDDDQPIWPYAIARDLKDAWMSTSNER